MAPSGYALIEPRNACPSPPTSLAPVPSPELPHDDVKRGAGGWVARVAGPQQVNVAGVAGEGPCWQLALRRDDQGVRFSGLH